MWSSGAGIPAGEGLAWLFGCVSRHRKTVISVLVLGGMWASLALVDPAWIGNGLFSLGAVVLGSDYRVLDYVGPGTPSERIHAGEDVAELIAAWFTVREDAVTAIEMNYRAKRLLIAESGRLDLSRWGNDDCRAVVSDRRESLTEGLPFWLCVESPVEESDGTLDYHLRLGSVELTRLSETDGDEAIAFFTVTEWESDFEDEPERQWLQTCKDAFRRGSEDVEPFLKVKRGKELETLTLSGWEMLYREFCVRDGRLAL